MVFTSSHISDVCELEVVSAASTYGIGLLTYIVYGFCNVFGLECNMYARKIEKAKTSATNKLIAEARNTSSDGIMNLSYQMSGMSVLAYGIAYETEGKQTVKSTPVSAKAKITDPVEENNPESVVTENKKSPVPKAVTHIDGKKIICPICKTVQPDYRLICINCEQKFINGQTDIPYWCNKCGHKGPYEGNCPSCGSSLKKHNPEYQA